MMLIISSHTPIRIRGVLQIWFLEVKPNVFVGNLTKVIENRIVKFLSGYMNKNTDMMIIRNDDTTIQGFVVDYPYNFENKLTSMSGLQLLKIPKKDP